MSKIKGYIEIRSRMFSETSRELADEILAKQNKDQDETVYGWMSSNKQIMTKVKDRNNLLQINKSIAGLDAINVLNKLLLDHDGGYLRVIYTDDSEGIIAEWTQED